MQAPTTTTADRVKKMMSDLGNIDQPSFGRLAGASKSVVNQWLSGATKSITAQYAFRLQRNTGYSAEWIQTGDGPEKLPELMAADSAAASYGPANDLWKRYQAASPAARAVVDLALRPAGAPPPKDASEMLVTAVRMAILAAGDPTRQDGPNHNKTAA